MSTILKHQYRSDRASTGHVISTLRPIKVEIGGENFIIKVALLKKCPDLIQDCYVGASPEALIFWLVDGSMHGRSLAEVREKLISGVK
jgi:hypothetical protein